MFSLSALKIWDIIFIFSILLLILLSTFVLGSVAPYVFPTQFIYLSIGFILLFILTKFDFEVFKAFSAHLYVMGIFLLIVTLMIGQVTRGAVRWIPIGLVSIQPSEVMRAFFILHFAKYVSEKELNIRRFIRLLFLFLFPFVLILIQPSLGVSFLLMIGFLGTLISSTLEKKYILLALGVFFLVLPVIWFFLAPYQKERIYSFTNPETDPLGSGYNSIQSMIAVGSGSFFGRGWGEGIQTQLKFLPEKHTDFIFAAISEELGLLGAIFVILCLFSIFWGLVKIISNPKDQVARSYVTGVFLVLFVQTFIHIGMNMGLMPITGVPLPFVSAGGSSLLGTIISVSIAMVAKKES